MPKNDDVSKGLNFNNLKNHNLRDICEKCYEMFKEEGRDVQYQDSHENVSSLLMNSSSKSEC